MLRTIKDMGHGFLFIDVYYILKINNCVVMTLFIFLMIYLDFGY